MKLLLSVLSFAAVLGMTLMSCAGNGSTSGTEKTINDMKDRDPGKAYYWELRANYLDMLC